MGASRSSRVNVRQESRLRLLYFDCIACRVVFAFSGPLLLRLLGTKKKDDADVGQLVCPVLTLRRHLVGRVHYHATHAGCARNGNVRS